MRLLDFVLAPFSPGLSPASIVVVNGHPDPRPERFCAAVAEAYGRGVRSVGGRADILSLGALKDENGRREAMDRILRNAELAIVFPLWLDKPPPLLASLVAAAGPQSCRDAIVTMAMPAFVHRSTPVPPEFAALGRVRRATFIGSIETLSLQQRQDWLAKIEGLGRGIRAGLTSA